MLKDLSNYLVNFSMRTVYALVVLVVGLFAVKHLSRFLKSLLEKSKIDKTLKPFLYSTISIGLKVLLVAIVVRIIGVKEGSIIAVLGAASLSIGLAFQGTLANIASGIILLITKPLRAGDYVEVSGKEGTVEAVHLFSTKLITMDNKVIFVPSHNILTSELTNYTMMETRRVELIFGVDYASDIDKVKSVLLEEAAAIPEVLKNPEPFAGLSAHAESSLKFVLRVWVSGQDYWKVYFVLMENVKKRFDQEKISIPFPVIDLRTRN